MNFLSYLPVILNNIWLYGALLVLVVNFVIFIHELGHFLVARRLGIPAEGFSIGFGRELIGRTDKHGTRWSLRLLPVGGYVKFGDDSRHPVSHRAAVAVAGPVANFVLALMILLAVYMILGKPTPSPYVAALVVDAPAHKVGIKVGDVFQSVNGISIYKTEDVREIVQDKAGVTVTVVILRNGKEMTFSLAPKNLEEKNSYGLPTHRGYLGTIWPSYGLRLDAIYKVDGVNTKNNSDLARQKLLQCMGRDCIIDFGKKKVDTLLIHPEMEKNLALKDPQDKDYDVLTLGKRPKETMLKLPITEAVKASGQLVWKGINQTLGVVFQIFTGTQGASDLGGVVKISQMTADAAGKGLFTFFCFVALLSVNIGIINLLPIPGLDGGHLLFHGAEAVRGAPVPFKAKAYIYGFGLIFLMLVIFIVNVNDVITAVFTDRS